MLTVPGQDVQPRPGQPVGGAHRAPGAARQAGRGPGPVLLVPTGSSAGVQLHALSKAY